jgi:hypothetical protein
MISTRDSKKRTVVSKKTYHLEYTLANLQLSNPSTQALVVASVKSSPPSTEIPHNRIQEVAV